MNMAKSFIAALLLSVPTLLMAADGWPKGYTGVMLQGFYWDSYSDSEWTILEKQSDEVSRFFSLLWIPQSGKAQNATSMGYDPLYYYNQNSSFGTEAELKSMIKTYKSKGTGIIADVVINHRGNYSNWVDFPKETNPNDGKTYQMVSTDVCKNDDYGKAATEASKIGLQVSKNNDSGEDWVGMRDLDHYSTNVQENVKAYLKYLIEYLGYTGFRYDMVKGYAASFTGLYNSTINPEFSVGEYWDGNATTVKNWLNGTKVDGVIQSAAFDFPFRYTVRDAANNGDWSKLANASVMRDANYSQYAVTFIENHDTELRSATNQQDPIRKDTLAGNAYMLAMPGTPCVFLKHWMKYRNEIASMIEVRRLAGVCNQSTASPMHSNKDYYAAQVKTNGENRMIVVVGKDLKTYIPSASDYTEVLSGYHYKYYLANKLETAWADKASCKYNEAIKVKLTAVSTNNNAQLVYTTDGSTPTASSTKATTGTELDINTATTLKVGLLVDGNVTGIITREYTFKYEDVPEEETFDTPEDGYTFTAYFIAPSEWTKNIMCWAWNSNNSNVNYTGGSWPGTKCVKIGKSDEGNYIWQWCYYGDMKDAPTHIIFSNNGSPQTADMTFTNNGWYQSTSKHAEDALDIKAPQQSITNGAIYNLAGQKVTEDYRGIIISNGKKILKK